MRDRCAATSMFLWRPASAGFPVHVARLLLPFRQAQRTKPVEVALFESKVVGDLVQDGLGPLAPQLTARAAQPFVGALEDADQGRSGQEALLEQGGAAVEAEQVTVLIRGGVSL